MIPRFDSNCCPIMQHALHRHGSFDCQPSEKLCTPGCRRIFRLDGGSAGHGFGDDFAHVQQHCTRWSADIDQHKCCIASCIGYWEHLRRRNGDANVSFIRPACASDYNDTSHAAPSSSLTNTNICVICIDKTAI